MKTNTRKLNFNAGPAMLPEEVLQIASEAVMDHNGSGISVLELQHRGDAFEAILEECNSLVRELCELGKDYEIVWVHGGGRQLFCMIPMNFLGEGAKAGFIDSGHWAEEAQKYAAFYGDALTLASSKEQHYRCLPELPLFYDSSLKYVHFTTNNTIYGTQWHQLPAIKCQLVADMSSDIFSIKRNYRQFGLFYAAAQKNLGISGVGLAVIRKDFLATKKQALPPFLDFSEQVRAKSVVNTSNVFGIYMALLMLRWTKARGLETIEKENRQKAKIVYDALDQSESFIPYVSIKEHRSLTNIVFKARDKETESKFNALCLENNITGIGGHRSLGGFRVSLYNAVALKDVERLVEVMDNG